MYIESVPNRKSPPAMLLRESFRDAGKVKKRTLANLSKWPATLIDGLRVLAMIVARVLDPGSKLATAQGLAADTARDSLAETLGLQDCDEHDLYAAMDWLLKRQEGIERRLAGRHLVDGALVESGAVQLSLFDDTDLVEIRSDA